MDFDSEDIIGMNKSAGTPCSLPSLWWQPPPIFPPGESHGQRSLAGYSSWVAKIWTRPSNSLTHSLTHTHTHTTEQLTHSLTHTRAGIFFFLSSLDTFFFFFLLHYPGRNLWDCVETGVEKVRVDTFILFLIFVEKHSCFIIKYDVSCVD